MRTQPHSFVTALVLLSLLSGAIGCKNNGGAWYKPNSYSWHNPFKSKEDTLSPYSGSAAKPSIGAQPNVATPPGGYGDKAREAEFQASKAEKQVQVQHGNTITGGAPQDPNRVAMSEFPAYGGNIPAEYTYPDPNVYPSQYAPHTGTTPQNYQQTSIQQSVYSPHYPAGPNPADYAAPNTGMAPPVANYSPFAPPAHDPALQQGFPAPASHSFDGVPQQQGFGAPPQQEFGAPPQQGFGAPPQQGFGAPPQQGFGADAHGYTAPPSYGSGYTATPSTTGF